MLCCEELGVPFSFEVKENLGTWKALVRTSRGFVGESGGVHLSLLSIDRTCSKEESNVAIPSMMPPLSPSSVSRT